MGFIVFIQAIIAVLLSFAILLQHKASGMSIGMGGAGVTFVQRRGAEKVLHQGTIVLSIAFFILTLVDWFV
ncbi:preprotein translocase subunit SecG [Candidatus Peribacteria bacterium]|nr:MAG: preprotein translocase subunit SecG [Candidatus Peribacteria bacterium]